MFKATSVNTIHRIHLCRRTQQLVFLVLAWLVVVPCVQVQSLLISPFQPTTGKLRRSLSDHAFQGPTRNNQIDMTLWKQHQQQQQHGKVLRSTTIYTPWITISSRRRHPTCNRATANDDDPQTEPKNTFSFAQRIESTKSALVGLVAGGVALAPVSFLHNCLWFGENNLYHNPLGQFEFDTDMGSLEAALFAIVYRYCLRRDDEENPQLNQGIVTAFVLTRTLSQIQVPTYCSAVPLTCEF